MRDDLIATVRLPRVLSKRRVKWVWRERELRLPTNLAAEVTILGAIMLDNADFAQASATLDSDDFSLESHRRIFLRMSDLMTSGHAVDTVTLGEELSKHKEIESVGGMAYLASLTDGLPRRPRITEYLAIVKEKAKLRRIMGVCTEAINKAEYQRETAASIVKQMGQGLKGIK